MSQIDDVFANIMRDVATSLEKIGKVEEQEIKVAIGIPVQYFGDTVIRSLPDEPPRKETGELQENISSFVEFDANSATLEVSSSRPSDPEVPYILEFGVGIKQRPYMRPSLDRMKATTIEALANDLKAR